jgi:hypothetical protein
MRMWSIFTPIFFMYIPPFLFLLSIFGLMMLALEFKTDLILEYF